MTEDTQRPLRLLSLDGGGVRGLSSIMILRHIMDGVNEERAEDDQVEPWQLFDMIGGTSTGGIIAIMLGRLHMTLDECEEVYLKLSKTIFQPKRGKVRKGLKVVDFLQANGKFDSKLLEDVVKECISRKLSEDSLLKESSPSCKVFVCAARENNAEPAILRSYKYPKMVDVLYNECKIWEACRATSAATTFFDPITIGKFGQTFVDGGILYNNPIQLVHREAGKVWPDQKSLLISIGTGSAPGKEFKGNLGAIIKSMKDILTQTERTANDFHQSHADMVKENLLFRFNVTHGLANIGLEEYKEIGAMADATQSYLENGETGEKLNVCIGKLSGIKPEANQAVGDLRHAIAEWLSPLNFFQKQRDVLSRRHPGTGQWLLDSSELSGWLSGPEQTLWCHGIPGAGKTVLASIVVDHLRQTFQEEKFGVACVYCDYKDRIEQSPVNIIGSLLKQLIQDQEQLPISKELNTLYDRLKRRDTRPTVDECSEVLQSEIRRYTKVFVVIDALDECPDDDGSRVSLLRLLGTLKGINLMVTCRPHVNIEHEFENTVRLEISASSEDIRGYLEERIKREGQLAALLIDRPELRNDILKTLVKKAKGMFLLAQLHIASLAEMDNIRDVRRALQNLPEALYDTYSEAMRRIDRQSSPKAKRARQILSWISHAFRPLTVLEARHALAVELGDSELDEEALPEKVALVSVCAGLVTVDNESNIIRLVHYTTQEYFERKRQNLFPDSQKMITEACLTYLSFDIFAGGHCHSDEELDSRLWKSPLLRYAAKHWGNHARGNPERTVKEFILKFLRQELKLSCSIQAMHIPDYQYASHSQRFPMEVTALQVAATFGLKEITSILLETNADVHAKDSDGSTALHWAAKSGHEAVVELLLESGADIEVKDNNGGTALHCAASNGYEVVVRLLLKYGAGNEVKDSDGGTALYWAVKKKHKGVVGLLLENGADIEAKDNNGGTALHCAASNGYEEVVRQLLEAKADIHAKDSHGWTALHQAAERGHEEVVRFLLKAKADADAKSIFQYTALHQAARKGHEAVVRLLLEANADVNATDSWTEEGKALYPEDWGPHELVMRVLLNPKDVEVSIVYAWIGLHSGGGKVQEATALHRAAEGGYEGVVRLLLDTKVDVEAKNIYGGTALHEAAIGGHEEVVRLLLEAKADIEAKNICGGTTLHRAAERGREAVVWLLLDAKANIDAKDIYGRGVLHGAAQGGHEAVVRPLLVNMADIEAKDNDGRTALHCAIENKREEVVRLLLDNGAKLDS